jgi:peptidoglycan-associated lipoprotein
MSYRSTLALGAAAALGFSMMLAGCATKPAPKPAPAKAPAAAPAAPAAPSAPVAAAPTGPVPGSVADFQASAGDRVYFDYNESAIRADAKPVLDAQAAWLQRYPSVVVRLEGNADERGTQEYNLALGARRAQAVRDYLLAHGVAATRMSTISYGKDRPIDTSGTEEGMAKNRNVHTDITGGAR